MPNDREARLKREFAHLYPGLKPGVWYKAAWLSARQFARVRCDGRASSLSSSERPKGRECKPPGG